MHNASGAIDDAAFVRSLYAGLLDREPDGSGFEFHLKRLKEGAITKYGLAMEMLASPEFQRKSKVKSEEPMAASDFRVFEGYERADLEVFSRFDVSKVVPTPGYLTDWIGSRVRLSSLWDSAACEGADRRVLPLPIPSDYHAAAIEWIGTLKAVLASKGSFSVMELGAGHGPWLAASCAAARSLGITELHLCGVEADPRRFNLLKQNIEDNRLSDADTVLHQAAVGVEDGHARWPRIAQPVEVAGARPIRHGNSDDERYLSLHALAEGIPNDFIDVEVVALPKLLQRRPLWDLLHIDIQGTELELCEGCIGELSRGVRYIVIGTHARWIDGDLMRLFIRADWTLEHEQPAKLFYKPYRELNCDVRVDGTQVWRNAHMS